MPFLLYQCGQLQRYGTYTWMMMTVVFIGRYLNNILGMMNGVYTWMIMSIQTYRGRYLNNILGHDEWCLYFNNILGDDEWCLYFNNILGHDEWCLYFINILGAWWMVFILGWWCLDSFHWHYEHLPKHPNY